MEQGFWEKRWSEGSTGWDLGHPHEQCPEILEIINAHFDRSQSKVLVPGCGTGHDACFFAQKGFEVVGCDFVGEAVEKARSLYDAIEGLRFEQRDIYDSESYPENSFDLIYDRAMLCALPAESRLKYLENCCSWLKKDGIFVSLLFSRRRRDREKGPPFELNIQDFMQLTKNLFVLEDIYEYPGEDLEVITQEARVICRLKGEP